MNSALKVLEMCEKAMRENEEKRDSVSVIVHVRGRKVGMVHRLFRGCPRGKVVKRFKTKEGSFFSVEYNAQKLADALSTMLNKVSEVDKALRGIENNKS